MKKGMLFAAAAYTIWGFYPIYFKALQSVPAFQIMTHRVVWCFLLIVCLVWLRGELPVLRAALNLRLLLIYLAAGLILSLNWFVYIWGVNAGLVVETSLGYFINPLVSVLLGLIFLGERLRPAQWASVGLAALGVAYLAINYGSVPWIALTLATSFGFYGLFKKVGPLDSLPGLALETGVVFLPALGYLVYEQARGVGSFAQSGMGITILLILCGVVTAVPLLFFAGGVRRVPLSTMGLLQYINPSLQLLIGVFLFREPFSEARAIGFAIIWGALLVYSLEGFFYRRKLALSPA